MGIIFILTNFWYNKTIMVKINKTMFREYDIRGQINNQGFNKKSAELIGKAFGTYLNRKRIKTIVVGRDYRSYSEELEMALICGLSSTGIHIIDIGLCLTPMLYYAQYYFKSKGGAMITASHNPNGWSGVKLAADFSKTLQAKEIQEIYEIIKSGSFKIGQGLIEKDHKSTHIKEAYTQSAIRRVNIKKPLKVVVECGNGTASFFALDILKKAMFASNQVGSEVVELFCKPDWDFPHHIPNPESEEVKKILSKKVKQVKADLGVSFDGDGDRLGVVDELGNNIWSDKLFILLARQALKGHSGAKIVFDVKCTRGLAEDIKKHKGIPIMCKTGHSNIKNKIFEEKAILGGERSGHFFILDNWYGFDDGIFACLKFLEFLSNQDKPLSEIIKTIPYWDYLVSPTLYIFCSDNKKFHIADSLVKEFKKDYGNKKVIDIDGARVEFKNAWGLVRASSTQPALTLNFEAKNKQEMKKIKDIFKKKLSKYLKIKQQLS